MRDVTLGHQTAKSPIRICHECHVEAMLVHAAQQLFERNIGPVCGGPLLHDVGGLRVWVFDAVDRYPAEEDALRGDNRRPLYARAAEGLEDVAGPILQPEAGNVGTHQRADGWSVGPPALRWQPGREP